MQYVSRPVTPQWFAHNRAAKVVDLIANGPSSNIQVPAVTRPQPHQDSALGSIAADRWLSDTGTTCSMSRTRSVFTSLGAVSVRTLSDAHPGGQVQSSYWGHCSRIHEQTRF